MFHNTSRCPKYPLKYTHISIKALNLRWRCNNVKTTAVGWLQLKDYLVVTDIRILSCLCTGSLMIFFIRAMLIMQISSVNCACLTERSRGKQWDLYQPEGKHQFHPHCWAPKRQAAINPCKCNKWEHPQELYKANSHLLDFSPLFS